MKRIWNTLTQPIEWHLPHYKPPIQTTYLRIVICALLYLIFTIWGNITIAHAQLHTASKYFIALNCTTILAAAIWVFQFNIPNAITKWMNRACIVLLPLLTVAMTEASNTPNPAHPPVYFLIISFYVWVYFLGYALTGQYKRGVFVFASLFWVIATTNYYVTAFRGTTFVPLDIFYANTAATVAKSYDFTPNYGLILSTAMLWLILGIAHKMKPNKAQVRWKQLTKRIVAIVLTATLFGGYYFTDYLADIGFYPNFYEQERSASRFGVPMNFWMNIKYLKIQPPKGYDADTIEDKMMELLQNTNYETTDKKPHIICIMNEAFSDLAVRGEFNTNMDYMPFVRSLTENTIKGNLYMPVLGNGTCNSELEVLSGYSTAFAPAGSKPYSLYIKEQLPSIAHALNAAGYDTMSFHPYYKNNWNRIAVYDYMGFNRYYGMEDVVSEETLKLMQTYAPLSDIISSLNKTYPDKHYLTRHYLNDAFDYDMLIQWYEEAEASENPLFLFNVTMQNHGGFEPIGNFNPKIYITNEDGTPRKNVENTNQYLSLVYESDQQLKRLVEYFEKRNEPVIVVMFGDHQPTTGDNEWLLEIAGLEFNADANLKQNQDKYITPFFIWANYDIEEQSIDKMSSNYLGSYIMKIAGLEMPLYNQYLLKLYETLPVINTQGYIDNNGVYYNFESNSPYKQLVENYKHICYNLLFDTKNRNTELYMP